MLLPRKEPRRRFTCKEKRKKKMSEYDTGREDSNWSKSNSTKDEDDTFLMKSDSAKKAQELVN